MSKKVKMLSIVLCISILFVAVGMHGTATYADVENNNLTAMEMEALEQTEAINAYHAIYDHVIYDTLVDGGYYHNEYAGCYINDENKLVVCVKNGGTSLITEINAILENSGIVEFEYKEWAMNAAVNALEEYEAFLSDSVRENIIGIGYSSKENSFIINVEQRNTVGTARGVDDNLGVFTEGAVQGYPIKINIINSDSTLNVRENESNINTDNQSMGTYAISTIYGGHPLYWDNGTGYALKGTIGVCGTFQGSRCVITAAHVAMNQNRTEFETLYLKESNNSALSEPVLYGYEVGDYAVLAVPTTGYYLSNTVFETENGQPANIFYYDSNEYIELEGRRVFRSGSITDVNSGVIDSTMYTGSGGNIIGLVGVELRDSDITQALAAHGDSGGPVWCVTEEYGRVLVGVVQGIAGDNQRGFCYSPIYLATSRGFNPFGMAAVTLDETVE